MALYDYECLDCGATAEAVRKVDNRYDAPTCCGVKMNLIISCRRVIGDIEPYYDSELQTGIKSRQHRKEVMREQGVYDKRDFKGQKWRNKRNASL